MQDIAVSGLIYNLSACVEGRVSPEYAEVAFECVRAAVADTDWHGKLLSTVNDLHTCADGMGWATCISNNS
jgi:hypothetical protein